jgi:EAL domain-containing protein (putative c-di-GMP-specific phosphodiesterase class I)
MRAWLDAGFPPIKVAVNLSARHFRLANLYQNVSDALARHRIDPRTLELEITEGAMMNDVAMSARASERLKEIGVRLSLDDFGTGYSSLAYLSRFPIDVVKIDQSFVRDITSNPSQRRDCPGDHRHVAQTRQDHPGRRRRDRGADALPAAQRL